MAILKYVPKNVEVLDRRSENGGYYIATCEECGREFYPKNKKAKYCSKDCANHSYVRVNAASIKKSDNKIKKDEYPAGRNIIGANQVVEYISDVDYDLLRGKKGSLTRSLKEMEDDSTLTIGKFIITKISSIKYNIKIRS